MEGHPFSNRTRSSNISLHVRLVTIAKPKAPYKCDSKLAERIRTTVLLYRYTSSQRLRFHNTPIILNQRVVASMVALKASQNNIGVKLAGYSTAASLSPHRPTSEQRRWRMARRERTALKVSVAVCKQACAFNLDS